MKNLKACIYFDEDLVIRKADLISELLKKKIEITVVTLSKISLLKKFGNRINYRIRFNNIETIKKRWIFKFN